MQSVIDGIVGVSVSQSFDKALAYAISTLVLFPEMVWEFGPGVFCMCDDFDLEVYYDKQSWSLADPVRWNQHNINLGSLSALKDRIGFLSDDSIETVTEAFALAGENLVSPNLALYAVPKERQELVTLFVRGREQASLNRTAMFS